MDQIAFIGNRAYDGIVFALLFPQVQRIYAVEHCCYPPDLPIGVHYTRPASENLVLPRTSSVAIAQVTSRFRQELDAEDATILPYDLPDFTTLIERRSSVINWQVVSRRIPRAVQRMLLQRAGVGVPRWMHVDEATPWAMLRERIGEACVVQFDHTSNSAGTYLVTDEQELLAARRINPGSYAIASEFLDGAPIALHLLIEEGGRVLQGLPSVQVFTAAMQGPRTAAARRYAGNDFSAFDRLSAAQKAMVTDCAQRIGKALYEASFIGMFGIDIMLTADGAFVLECNFRLTNSTALMTILEEAYLGGSLMRRLLGGPAPAATAPDRPIRGAQLLTARGGVAHPDADALMHTLSAAGLSTLTESTASCQVGISAPAPTGEYMARVLTNDTICDEHGILLAEFHTEQLH